MKKLLLSVLALCAIASSAMAALPEIVVNTTGTAVYGTHGIISVSKNTDSGNRVALRYASGTQYVADDAAWSKYGKVLTACGASCVTVDGSPTGMAYNVASSNGVVCWSSGTVLSWPNVAMSEQLTGDGCAYWAKVKANAN